MDGERVFCSRFKLKVPTNLNPPRHRRERYCPGFVRDNAKNTSPVDFPESVEIGEKGNPSPAMDEEQPYLLRRHHSHEGVLRTEPGKRL
jgi:hypothetical protein